MGPAIVEAFLLNLSLLNLRLGCRHGDDGASRNPSSSDGNRERLGAGLRQGYAKRGKRVGENGEWNDIERRCIYRRWGFKVFKQRSHRGQQLIIGENYYRTG